MKVEVVSNADGEVAAYVVFSTRGERDTALRVVMSAFRSKCDDDAEVEESIPNDKGFIDSPMFFVRKASKKTPNIPVFLKGYRNSHRIVFRVNKGKDPVAPPEHVQ